MARSSRGGKQPGGTKGRAPTGPRLIAASEFKAHCLRLLEAVAAGQEVLVTKRGKEIARVVPAQPRQAGSSRGRWKSLMTLSGEIVHTDWSSEFDASR
jgi:prevent-host-death family protein